MTDFGIHFGAMADPIAEQCIKQGYSISDQDSKRLQGLADAITMLHLHDIIPDSSVQKAHLKLLKKITGCKSFSETTP